MSAVNLWCANFSTNVHPLITDGFQCGNVLLTISHRRSISVYSYL